MQQCEWRNATSTKELKAVTYTQLEVFSEDIPHTIYSIFVEQSGPEVLFNSFQ